VDINPGSGSDVRVARGGASLPAVAFGSCDRATLQHMSTADSVRIRDSRERAGSIGQRLLVPLDRVNPVVRGSYPDLSAQSLALLQPEFEALFAQVAKERMKRRPAGECV
jgi:hypothetical protein